MVKITSKLFRLFVHVTPDTSIWVYDLRITKHMLTSNQYNIINSNTKFKQLDYLNEIVY